MSTEAGEAMDGNDDKLEQNSEQFGAQPSPPATPPLANHSDAVDDPESWSDSRKYQRGGRKQRNKPKAQSRDESQLPWSQRNGRLDSFMESDFEAEEEEQSVQLDPIQQSTTPQAPESATKERKSRKPKPSAFRSGISSFGVKRAKSGPPIGVHVDRGDEPKAQPTKSTKKKSKRKCETCEALEAEDNEEETSDEEKEPAPRKPVQIRLDLNLELEILLRAKIKGDITITFL